MYVYIQTYIGMLYTHAVNLLALLDASTVCIYAYMHICMLHAGIF